MKKVAILSDTHGLLRDDVKKYLMSADHIIHAGDITCKEVVDELASYASLTIVRGNNDTDWAENIPKETTAVIEGLKFLIIHDKSEIKKSLNGIDVVVYGHSHKYAEDRKEDVLWLNLGSCGKKRFSNDITMCMMSVTGNEYEIEQILF